MMKQKNGLVSGLIIMSFLLMAGCQHYKLGHPSESLPFKTLYVKPVVNKSLAPQAQALLTDQLITSLQQEGNVKLVADPEEADATLSITIVDYDRRITATSDKDTILASSYALELTAECTLSHNMLTVIYFHNKRIKASINAVVGDSQLTAEYQNMPILTRELALKVKNVVVSAW